MSLNKFAHGMKKLLFSQRQDVFKELRDVACQRSGVSVAWPDAILFLDDGDLKKAVRQVVSK